MSQAGETCLVEPAIVKPSAVIKRIMHCQIEFGTLGESCTEIHGPFEGLTSIDDPVNKVSQTFQVPTLSGTTYRIRARLWAADSWNTNENIYVHVQDPDNPSLEPAPKLSQKAIIVFGIDRQLLPTLSQPVLVLKMAKI